MVPTDIPYTHHTTQRAIYSLVAAYSGLSFTSIGRSVMGKDIYALSFGCGEKKLFINSTHHANEWITTPVLLKFIQRFMEAVTNKGQIYGFDATELYNNVRICCVPLVNPDGVDLVNGAISTESSEYLKALEISKCYPDVPFPRGWKANIEGVDLNLNYPAGWGNARAVKAAKGVTSAAPRDFVGRAPLCAPETRAVYSYTLTQNFDMTLSYHTQGKVIYWKYLDYLPQDSEEIGRTLSRASGYRLEVTPSDSAYGGYKDWFISCYNLPGYTVEAGEGESPLPIEDFDGIYHDNEGLIASAINILM